MFFNLKIGEVAAAATLVTVEADSKMAIYDDLLGKRFEVVGAISGDNDPLGGPRIYRLPQDVAALRKAIPSLPRVPPHKCKYCGAPSWYEPSEQSPPPDYCHESDHGMGEAESYAEEYYGPAD